MTERPILFSAPMVRATLDDRKTQTRRVVKPGAGQKWLSLEVLQTARSATVHLASIAGPGVQLEHPQGGPLTFINAPYGVPGDLLWVRETLRFDWTRERWTYDADKVPLWTIGKADLEKPRPDRWPTGVAVSIHMPRSACRLRLRVTDVRVERLNEIDDSDAFAEGVALADGGGFDIPGADALWQPTARGAYRVLWERINGEGSWGANPWVWAVSFERVP